MSLEDYMNYKRYVDNEDNKETIRLAIEMYGSYENAVNKFSEMEDKRHKKLCSKDPSIRIKQAKLTKYLKIIEEQELELKELKRKLRNSKSIKVALQSEIASRSKSILNGMRKGKKDE